MTRRARIAALTLAALAACPLAACSKAEQAAKPPAKVNPHATTLRDGFTDLDGLVRAAKEEGELTLIGVSRDRLNFGALVSRFSEEYGIDVRLAEPDASSGRQIEAAKRVKPDVFDLRLDVAVANAKHFAPYRVAAWDEIPDDLKEPGGAWYAAYGGYISIGYDSRQVHAPASFDDLLRPNAGKAVRVALPGDPRQVAAAFDGVMASALIDGWPKVRHGVEFFTELKKRHRLATPERATVLIDWDHANLTRGATAGAGTSAWKVVVPRDAVLAGYQVQAINKNAPHPAAARLWQEFLFSDTAQNLLLKGYARPVRMEAMEMHGTLDAEAAAKLPKANGEPVILTVPQTDEGRTYLRGHWTAAVG
ncbi:ABC transporter substrate-binding protein [Thermopolyspora sp. NPDC052614]|uniref:ABC transporter substrate-binding protein n=1 Tax=Thermopolyspora sp. NPDC052614 TaxID=3155682 RepID=UPI00343ECE29